MTKKITLPPQTAKDSYAKTLMQKRQLEKKWQHRLAKA